MFVISGPQLIVSVYGLDTFGNDVVRGYGVCHLPVINGQSSQMLVFNFKLYFVFLVYGYEWNIDFVEFIHAYLTWLLPISIIVII